MHPDPYLHWGVWVLFPLPWFITRAFLKGFVLISIKQAAATISFVSSGDGPYLNKERRLITLHSLSLYISHLTVPMPELKTNSGQE
jgi:hypothetical protein